MTDDRKFVDIVGEGVVVRDELLAESSIGREVRLKMIDVSGTLEKLGFTAVGVAITLNNSGSVSAELLDA